MVTFNAFPRGEWCNILSVLYFCVWFLFPQTAPLTLDSMEKAHAVSPLILESTALRHQHRLLLLHMCGSIHLRPHSLMFTMVLPLDLCQLLSGCRAGSKVLFYFWYQRGSVSDLERFAACSHICSRICEQTANFLCFGTLLHQVIFLLGSYFRHLRELLPSQHWCTVVNGCHCQHSDTIHSQVCIHVHMSNCSYTEFMNESTYITRIWLLC